MSETPKAEAMERARKAQPEGYAPQGSVVDRLHSLLPEWLSARAAVMRKRAQLRDLDRATADDAPPPERAP